jgi:hypothetical protein
MPISERRKVATARKKLHHVAVFPKLSFPCQLLRPFLHFICGPLPICGSSRSLNANDFIAEFGRFQVDILFDLQNLLILSTHKVFLIDLKFVRIRLEVTDVQKTLELAEISSFSTTYHLKSFIYSGWPNWVIHNLTWLFLMVLHPFEFVEVVKETNYDQ